MTDIHMIVESQREYFLTGATLPVGARIANLKRLQSVIRENEDAIAAALYEDLHKSKFEAYETETGVVLDELRFFIKKLPELARPRRISTPITHFPSSTRLYKEPYGCVLIMSPWNYPFHLGIMPLIGAIAGGNCAVLKTSASAPATSGVIGEMIGKNFDSRFLAVVEGSDPVSRSLTNEKFDLIFFTGSMNVGRQILEKAAATLTPAVLELGGKSPCIVDETANIALAAKRILWGKSINAGQTCVAPDYVVVQRAVSAQLLEEMKRTAPAIFGADPLENPEYPCIINEKHFLRLKGLINSGHVYYGGRCSEAARTLGPAIMDGVKWEDPVMQEEIFGPVLPVLIYDSIDELTEKLAVLPHPLALYLFTRSRETEEKIMTSVPFGGGCVNDTIMHVATNRIPFGGVGASGMGHYHGRSSFETFTHAKGVVKTPARPELQLRFPPYEGKMGLLKKFLH